MTTGFNNVKDVFDAVRVTRDRLQSMGAADLAKALSDTLDGYWTTGSEALIELLQTIDEVRPQCTKTLDATDLVQLDEARAAALRLLNLR